MDRYRGQEGRWKNGFPKEDFPKLLKEVWEKMAVNFAANAMSGFRKCGIYPLNKEEVLKELPDYSETHESLGNALTEFLRENRQGPERAERRRRRIQVAPGTSVTAAQLAEPEPEPESEDEVLYRLASTAESDGSEADDDLDSGEGDKEKDDDSSDGEAQGGDDGSEDGAKGGDDGHCSEEESDSEEGEDTEGEISDDEDKSNSEEIVDNSDLAERSCSEKGSGDDAASGSEVESEIEEQEVSMAAPVTKKRRPQSKDVIRSVHSSMESDQFQGGLLLVRERNRNPKGKDDKVLHGITLVDDPSELNIGDYVLVDFADVFSKSKQPYVGRLVEPTRAVAGDLEATFFHPKPGNDGNLFVLPQNEDRCCFSKNQIMGKVAAPTPLRRGIQKFMVDWKQF